MAEEDLPEAPYIRRVVTGHDGAGKAKVLIDGPATNARHPPGSRGVSTLMWVTDEMPADIAVGDDVEDMGERILGTPPPVNGTRFNVIEMGPHSSGEMHRTETLDYAIVITGRVDMKLDEETVHLNAGDIVIQRGTYHQWINPGDEPARIAFVLVDAKPLGIGTPRPRQ